MTEADTDDDESRHASVAAIEWMQLRWHGPRLVVRPEWLSIVRVTDFLAAVELKVQAPTLAWVDACALVSVGVYMHYNVAPPARVTAVVEVGSQPTAPLERTRMRVQAALMDDGDELPFFSVHLVNPFGARIATARVSWKQPG